MCAFWGDLDWCWWAGYGLVLASFWAGRQAGSKALDALGVCDGSGRHRTSGLIPFIQQVQQLQAADLVAVPAEAVVEADKTKKEANKGKNDKDCDKDVRAY